jgi:predicted RNA-binding protein with PIN domain
VDTGSGSLDAELQAIFERTYGEIKQRDIRPNRVNARMEKEDRYDFMDVPEFLLVDGYNIVHAWDDLRDVAWENMDLARQMLLDQVCAYQSVRKCHCIVVFDAYRVERAVEDVLQYHNIHVVFTKQAETADTYIERATYEISKRHRVRVATSDNAEQMIVMGHGAFRMSAREFKEEVELAKKVLESNVRDWNRSEKDRIGQQIFDKRNRTKGIAK